MYCKKILKSSIVFATMKHWRSLVDRCYKRSAREGRMLGLGLVTWDTC